MVFLYKRHSLIRTKENTHSKISKRAHFHHPAEKHVLMIKGIETISIIACTVPKPLNQAFITKNTSFSVSKEVEQD